MQECRRAIRSINQVVLQDSALLSKIFEYEQENEKIQLTQGKLTSHAQREIVIIDEALLFYNKMAGDFSRYMIECVVTTKKQQTKVAQYQNSTFEMERVDKTPEPDSLEKME